MNTDIELTEDEAGFITLKNKDDMSQVVYLSGFNDDKPPYITIYLGLEDCENIVQKIINTEDDNSEFTFSFEPDFQEMVDVLIYENKSMDGTHDKRVIQAWIAGFEEALTKLKYLTLKDQGKP